jgi:hypothetical protein
MMIRALKSMRFRRDIENINWRRSMFSLEACLISKSVGDDSSAECWAYHGDLETVSQPVWKL